ncbi:MAG: TolC family protein, partial [Phycisphaerales bacterium]
IKGGYQYLEEGDDSALIVGLSIPVPLFDRNQGGIQEAGHLLAKTEDERRAAKASVLAALSAAVERLSGAYVEANVLKEEILPAAQSAFDAASEGYREGKFDYLSVLDAQRMLFEAKGQYIESLAGYHKARADVERLVGQRIDTLDAASVRAAKAGEIDHVDENE